MDPLAWSVLAGAAGVAVVHAALGPDHTLPFVALARARGWSRARTIGVTAACGVAHVLSSLALGLLGLAGGVALGRLAELGRGRLAAWALVAVGLAYGAWGARRAWRSRRGLVLHAHDGHVHLHARGDAPHGHRAGSREPPHSATVWALVVVFVLGPCEPLIPLFLLPASQGRWTLAAVTAAVFGLVTVSTMVALVALAHAGLERLPLGALERWSHALAGGFLAASGLAVLALGL